MNMDISPSQVQALQKNKKPKKNTNKYQKLNDWNSIEDTLVPELSNFLDLSDLNEYNHYEKVIDQSMVFQKDDYTYHHHHQDQVTVSPSKISIHNQMIEEKEQINDFSQLNPFDSHLLVKAKSSSQLLGNKQVSDLEYDEIDAAIGAYDFDGTTQSIIQKSKEELKNTYDYQDNYNEEQEIFDNLEKYEYNYQEEINMNDSQINAIDSMNRREEQGSVSIGGAHTVPDFASASNDKSFNIDYLNCTVITSQQKSKINFGIESSKSTMSGSHLQQSQNNRYATTMDYVGMANNPTAEDSPLKPVFLQIESKSQDERVFSEKKGRKNKNTSRISAHHYHSNSQQLLQIDFKTAGSGSPSSNQTRSKRNSGQTSPVRRNKNNNKKVMFKDELNGGELCQVKEFHRAYFKCMNGCCEPDPDEDGGKISCSCNIF